ncbi:MAG: UvrD-helicase domain-containing protein [Ignavibacteriae bacterium]|nr:hypothetical protein [Ignavibacteriota bacterium]NOG97498.1 UvrD-helicase domain-containing protein [Ignavibacteriota bacterium]
MEKILTPYQKDALHYNKHIALTANAGSGKTFVLSRRYVDIAQKEKIPLRKIVAITFTDKAAGELNKNIAEVVEKRLNNSTNPGEIKTLEKIRRQLVSANISTIHSFCIEVLKEFSPEAGLDANFVPVDQTTADELIELSIEETLNQLLLNDSELDVKNLIRFFGSQKILSIEIKKLLKNRKAITDLYEKEYSKDESEIAEWFRNNFREKFKYLFIDKAADIKSLLAEINNYVLSLKPDNPIAAIASELIEKINSSLSPFEFIELTNQIAEQICTKAGGIKARSYLPNDEREDLTSQINEAENLISDILKIEIPDNSEEVEKLLAVYGKEIASLFILAADEYTSKKEERGYLDFEDILHHTKRIIGKPEVQEYLSSNYEYVMIDEYQDTNEIQYEIFMPILNNLKSGNLFVVGDEKQSIYMFRDADIKVFMRTKKEIEQAVKKDGILSLPHSFRVSPPIAAFTNEVFKELFKEPDIELNEVEHSNLVCARPEETIGSVQMIISDEEGEPEAELVAKKIITLMSDQNPDFGLNDIAILCRKRSVFAELEKAFSNHGIPHTVVAGKGFYQKQIVNDIYNYLSFLINRDDNTSLVGILRAPFFTLSDTEVFAISLEKGKTFFEKIINYSAENNKYNKIIITLTDHISIAQSSEFSFILRKIISDTEYLPVIAARENYKQELSNLEKLFKVAKSFEQQGFKSLYDFVDYLKTSIQNLVDEGQAAINEDEQSVKIMTIHQAKGLEFNTVFLFRCNDTSEEDRIKSRSIVVDKDFGILTKVPNANNYFEDFVSAPINGIYNYVSNRKNIGELKRLLYVGVTRAVQNLIITGTIKNGAAKKKSFLDFLTSALEIDLEAADHKIKTNLEFMKLKGEEYEFFDKKIEFDISIERVIESKINSLKISGKEKLGNKTYLLNHIEDKSEEEIISATKLAVYTQCPLKYQLTYELGYSDINSIFELTKSESEPADFEFQINENDDDDFVGYAEFKGRVIHKVLDEEIDIQNLNKRVDELLEKEFYNRSTSKKVFESVKNSILNDLQQFYRSQTYKELIEFSNYKNEHEIYLKLNDFYLYGIIDKLIIDNKKIIIVDYKTDNIKEEEINSRGELYLSQLKFYAVLINEIYNPNEIELRIVFTKFPDINFAKGITEKEINEFREYIKSVVLSIRNNNYPPDLNHCIKCHYAVDGKKCVKANSKT